MVENVFIAERAPGETSQMTLADALQLWVEITGVDPSKRNGAWAFGSMDVREMHVAIKESLELDDTEITGLMLFEFVATHYLREREFSAEELLEAPDRVAAYLSKCRALLSFLRSERMKSIGGAFSNGVESAVSAYGALTDRECRGKPLASAMGFERHGFMLVNNIV